MTTISSKAAQCFNLYYINNNKNHKSNNNNRCNKNINKINTRNIYNFNDIDNKETTTKAVICLTLPMPATPPPTIIRIKATTITTSLTAKI